MSIISRQPRTQGGCHIQVIARAARTSTCTQEIDRDGNPHLAPSLYKTNWMSDIGV
jgi:hypothetical protein